MTVHDVNGGLAASTSKAAAGAAPGSNPEGRAQPHHHEVKSCFFVWTLQSQHKVTGDDGKIELICDLCEAASNSKTPFTILDLKLHQIGQHINPYYLSAADRILAQISSYAITPSKTDGPWIPDWENFKVL